VFQHTTGVLGYKTMATKQTTTQERTDTEPSGWSEVDDRSYGQIAVFEHADGQRVFVKRDRQPTQMHDPMTSRDDTGFVARVERPDGRSAQLCPDLSAECVARDAATEFMASYPDGGFEIPEPSDQPFDGAVEW